jgi:hypothetical protein
MKKHSHRARAGHMARRKAAKSCGRGKTKVRGYSYRRKGKKISVPAYCRKKRK